MNYTPTIWSTGDVITADKLNNMETGIAGTEEQVVELKSATPLHLKYTNATKIPNNSDFNDYTTEGNYYVSSSASAGSMVNRPTNAAGRLVVLTTVSTSNIVQLYITNETNIFVRYLTAGLWSEWSYFIKPANLTPYAPVASPTFTGVPKAPTAVAGTTNTQIATTQFVMAAINALGKPISTDSSTAVQVPASTDLNDYLTIGNYRVATSAIAASITNIPITNPGKLVVLYTAGTSNVLQIYMETGGRTFLRSHTASGWAVWREFVTNNDSYQTLVSDVSRSKIAENGIYNMAKVLARNGVYDLAFANAPVSLNLKNYVGNTQNVHPKVMYFANGFGGHKYWMAYTPYPNETNMYENPCIAYSDDGYTWTNITGNPLDSPQGNGYDSDAHLVYRNDTGVLECWYRYVSTGNPRYETIYRQATTDGVNWGAKELVMQSTTAGASHYLSPSVLWDGTKYQIWVVDGTSIVYYEAMPANINTWNQVRTYTMAFTDSDNSANPWHLDVINDDGTYVMLVMTMVSASPRNKWSLFVATSADNITYNTPTKVMQGSDNWDEFLYRSSIVKIGSGYRIYYSALNSGLIYGLGITEADSLDSFVGVFTD